MTYPDGSEILVGDSVLFEKQRTPGIVIAVISGDFEEWNVVEPGVMVKSMPTGLVFIPASAFAGNTVGLALDHRGEANTRLTGL